jgi:CMP-N,N'-diacetyllegionaminic acid synthase
VIQGKRVLAVIPARGGSKGVPRKNLRVVSGKPLIWYTIEAAKHSRYLDEIVVSSEDDEILKVAASYGVSLLQRPAHLASDETPGTEPVLHAIESYQGFDYVVLLQPTSPLRTAVHIDGAMEFCLNSRAPACVSICEAETSPFSVFQLDEQHHLSRLMNVSVSGRRQDLPVLYTLNGVVYVAEIPWLKKERRFVASQTVGYLMSREESLDIDTEFDFLFLEFLLGKRSY